MNTQWRKIAGDFRQHRLQIFLIAVILILGTAGVVAAVGVGGFTMLRPGRSNG